MATPYVALIADLVGSRTLEPRRRAKLQAALRTAASDFNHRYAAALAARFAVTLGDELQALFKTAAPVWDVSHRLRLTFPEVDWVVACGRGALSTPIWRGATAPELDGPCFHAARQALDHAKRHRLVFALEGFEQPLAACADYYSALYWGWTRRQRVVAAAQRVWQGARLDDLAQRLKVGPSAISHLRRRMAWPLVAAGDTVFRELLAR
jgi:SatD family protein